MSLFIKGLIILLGCSFISCLQAEVLGLNECLKEALKSNPQVLSAQQDVVASEGAIMSAKSALFPAITDSNTVYLNNTDVFSQQTPPNPGFRGNWVVSLTLQQTLYNGGTTRNLIAISKLTNQAAAARLMQVINDTVFQTRAAFYQALLKKSAIDLDQESIDLLKREVERQKGLFAAGQATKFNIISTEVELANKQPVLEQDALAYESAIYLLMNALGRPAPARGAVMDVNVEGVMEVVPYSKDLDGMIREAVRQSPELTQAEKQIDIERRNIDVAHASNIPSVSFFANTQLVRTDNSAGDGFLDSHNQSAVGLLGSWNIFDGFAGKGSAMSAEARLRKSEITMGSTLRRIDYDVRRAMLGIQKAEHSLQLQAGNVDKARQSIGLARSLVEAGRGTQFDILRATLALSQAENLELNSRYDYNLALADLERITYKRLGNSIVAGSNGGATPKKVDATFLNYQTPDGRAN